MLVDVQVKQAAGPIMEGFGWLDLEGAHDSMGHDYSYGVCDTPEQFMERYREVLDKDPRKFVVSFMVVRKEKQSAGGWRWHKWGPYIGDKNPECEYLHDDGPEITQATVWHVYLVKEA